MSWIIGHFTSKGFACKCGCGLDKTSPGFLWKLNMARDYAGFAFVVTSGCRCEQHNKDEGGSKKSDHLCLPTCEGVDIQVKGSWMRFKVVEAAFKAGFKRIFPAETFVHLGDRHTNPQGVMFLYSIDPSSGMEIAPNEFDIGDVPI